MEDIYKLIQSALGKGERGALASVVCRKGSAPMSADAKMIIFQDGTVKGTLGGGCMEAEVWDEARQVMRQGRPTKMNFELTEKEAEVTGHICGGVVGVLIEPFSNFESRVLSEIIRLRNEKKMGVLVTVVSRSDGKPVGTADRLLVYRHGKVLGHVEGLEPVIVQEAVEVMRSGKPASRIFRLPDSDATMEVFLEPIESSPKVYIFGGGHVSSHISKVAGIAGFRLTIVEDRPQFANHERFPEVEDFVILKDLDSLEGAMPEINSTDMAVIVTRGHQYDEAVLCWAWDKPFLYLGMIGSRTKILVTYRRLEEKTGVSREEFIKRVRAPIGLEIGADTPGEIAVAIAAELIQVRRESLIRDPALAGRPKSTALVKLTTGGN